MTERQDMKRTVEVTYSGFIKLRVKKMLFSDGKRKFVIEKTDLLRNRRGKVLRFDSFAKLCEAMTEMAINQKRKKGKKYA